MPGDLLPLGDARQIDLLDDALVGLDDDSGIVAAEVHTKITLRAEHREPEPAFSNDLVLW
jgi:hypothetical protein